MEGEGAAAAGEFDVLRRFFRQIGGVPDAIVEKGTWDSLLGYTQGRIA